jgi:WG containing repeat
MIRYLFIIPLFWFLASCGGTIDENEDHMSEDCKCEAYGDLADNFYIEDRGGSVQPCAKTIGADLKWGFIIDNHACDEYLPFIYEDARSFYFGVAPVKLNGKWGVIDSTGKRVLDFKYQKLETFSDSLAAFMGSANTWGFINTHGDTIIQPQFSDVNGFWANLAIVYSLPAGWQVYNLKGERLPVLIDSLVNNYPTDPGMSSISYRDSWDGGGIYNEMIECPFYSKGEKVKLVGYREKYAVLPYSVDTRADAMERVLATNRFKPIFE